jgi:hypothetical protein
LRACTLYWQRLPAPKQ